MKKKFDIEALDDERISTLFEEAYRKQVDDPSNELAIGDVDVELEKPKPGEKTPLTVRVTIFAFAEHTPRLEYHNPSTGKIAQGAKTINVVDEGKGTAKFALSGSADRNTNDYDVLYTLRS
jgi:hypothetical protein